MYNTFFQVINTTFGGETYREVITQTGLHEIEYLHGDY